MARSKERFWLVVAEAMNADGPTSEVLTWTLRARDAAELIAKLAFSTGSFSGSVQAYELTGRVAHGAHVYNASFECSVEKSITDETEDKK